MRRFNPEKELNKLKNGNKNKIIVGLCTLLLIVVIGYSFALYQVRHTNKLVFNTVAEFKKRDIYLSVLVDGEYKNDFPNKTDDMLYGGYECDGDATINFNTDKWQVALYASHPDKCTIKFGHKYVDDSGANYPELYQGMIPVYFENGKIYVADVTSEWYNYDENKWANAVLIDYANKKDKFYDDNGNLLGGHEVSEEDILQMYVWIPRYKYQLFNVNNEGVPKQLINITFETGTANTGNIKCTYTNNNDGTITEDCKDKNTNEQVKNNDWYTHPAFTFKGTFEESGNELPGIWVGKFEPSDPTDENGRKNEVIDDITILPNKTSMAFKSIKAIYNAALNLENKYSLNFSNSDIHVIKNIEWGAVAYLTQSIYGIYKDENTCNIDSTSFEQCEVWVNNTAQGAGTTSEVTNNYGGTYTGCVGTSVSAAVQWNKDDGSPAKCSEGNRWNEKGVNASTTGNMYGVYDMNGGADEYVASVILDKNSGSSNVASNWFKNGKYYELYSYSNDGNSYDRGHLGDATREILIDDNGVKRAWNADTLAMPGYREEWKWFTRGGIYGQKWQSGIFAIGAGSGGGGLGVSSRIVITAQDGVE